MPHARPTDSQRPVVVDAHCDVLYAVCDSGLDLGRRQRSTHFDLVRARAGGLSAQFFALFAEPGCYPGETAWRRTLALLRGLEATIARHPGRLGLARSSADVRQHQAAGRLAAFVGLEGAHGLGRSSPQALVLRRLERLVSHGLRYFGLTWNNSNGFAGAAADGGGGLTPLGRRAVRLCQQHGVLIDVSHASDRAVRDLLAMTQAPVLASHSNARALCRVPRNLSDALLRAIGATGGVVCCNFFPGFLDQVVGADIEQRHALFEVQRVALHARYGRDRTSYLRAARRAARQAMSGVPRVPLGKVVEHIEHIATVAGEHAVGLGSDFDGILLTPEGLGDVAAFPMLERALAKRFRPALVRGILGENLLRVLDAAATTER
jgi:membrane dipeptidase